MPPSVRVAADKRSLAFVLDETCESVRIAPQSRRQHRSVPAIVLGTGRREAVPEAVHLARVDHEHFKAPLQERVDNDEPARLNRDPRTSGVPAHGVEQLLH
jgi:hypothetical protein